MIDPFVLLAPIFLLGVMALLGFVGCFTKPPRPEAPIPFIKDQTLGTLRTDAAFFGMTIMVGPDPLRVQTLGRFFITGNNGTHRIRLVDADDVNKAQLGFVTVSMVGGTEGTYQYGSLSPNVTLKPGQRYHIVSEELNPGDQFYDQDTMVRYDVPQTVTPAIVETGVYSDNPGLYVPVGGPEHSYGPVNFEYVIDS
jgi:hypothetical protein